MADVERSVGAELDRIAPVLDPLGALFAEAGHELALVGGPVRDAMLGRAHNDLDFTTSARPEETERLLRGWADAVWDMGRDFGTIGCRKGPWQVEVTTYRSESYDPTSRKPVVDFGDTLTGDLGRRDFTVNSMAVSLTNRRPRVRRPVRRPGRPGAPPAAHSRQARGLLLRRPAADAAGRPVRRPAGLHGRSRGRRRDDGDGRADLDHLGRADPRRARQAGAGAVPTPGPDPARRDRAGRAGAARAAGAGPRARRAPSSQGRLRAHPDRARAVDRPGAGSAGPTSSRGWRH